ncbi:MAG: hypothetical protein GX565_14465 [Lentisphaerae bacterium]|nr:hypothetical protein [Lentisphaerota bacterium]
MSAAVVGTVPASAVIPPPIDSEPIPSVETMEVVVPSSTSPDCLQALDTISAAVMGTSVGGVRS